MQDLAAEKRGLGARGWGGRPLPATLLLLRVHFDALMAEPRAYLVATWWRIRRKRVRSRAQMAPLLGRSAHAYKLWLLRETDAAPSANADSGAIRIVALVDLAGEAGNHRQIADTLASLAAEGVEAVVIGTADVPDALAAAALVETSAQTWLMPIAAGDVLRHGAVEQYRIAAATGQDLVYADDDRLEAGVRTHPHFKPDWNAELFAHHDYLTGSCIFRSVIANFSACSGQFWARQLVADAVSKGSVPAHIPQILHHRRRRPAPRLPGMIATSPSDLPTVTVIVPTRNRSDLLHTCLTGLAKTDYPAIEIIVVDNDSDDATSLDYLASLPREVRVLRHPGSFNFSAMNNRAAELASGELLCLLNNDIEIIEPSWLSVMARQALREDVGAVGAQLLYPDGRIQHAGVVTGIGGGAAHAHRLVLPNEEGYFWRHALPQFVTAVTAACLVVRRDRFAAVGGFDEDQFAVAFNDVDLCMRLGRRGWRSFYEPRAILTHHESVSRGLDRDKVGARRLAGELASLKAAWGTDVIRDPFHHPALSRFSERFVVQL